MQKTSVDKLLAEWFWIDRWVGSSAFMLPLEARGLYREMLTQAWRRGARLPNNHEAIRRAAGVSPDEWARCWPMVEPYWRVDGAELVNDTQAGVYAECVARLERYSAAGRHAAGVKYGKVVKPPAAALKVESQEAPPKTAFKGNRFLVWTWQHDALVRALGSTPFDLLGWYEKLDAEMTASGAPIYDEDKWLRERLYQAAGIERPNLFGKPRVPPGRAPCDARHNPPCLSPDACKARQRVEREQA